MDARDPSRLVVMVVVLFPKLKERKRDPTKKRQQIMVVVTSSSSASSLLVSVPEELPFRTKTIDRKSQSFENISSIPGSSATDSDDEYDFGPLLRFNLYVAGILYRYADADAAPEEEEEEDRPMMLDKIRYLLSAVGVGPVCARDSIVRHNVFRYVRSGPDMDLATDVIKHRRDVRALTRHGIRSPAFVHHNQDVPFDLGEKARVNTQVLDVIRNSNAPKTSDANANAHMELHRMWERIDLVKWDRFSRKPTPPPVNSLRNTIRMCWCCMFLVSFSVSVAANVAVLSWKLA